MSYKTLLNANGNLICSIAIQPNGRDPLTKSLVKICIWPLDDHLNLMKDKEFRPFIIDLQPAEESVTDKELQEVRLTETEYAKVIVNGLDRELGSDLIEAWFSKLPLQPYRKIYPLAYNWPWQSAFIRSWLGSARYNFIFDRNYRDTLVCTQLLNDFATMQCEQHVFPKVDEGYIASQLNIDHRHSKDVISKVVTTAEVYKHILHHAHFFFKNVSFTAPVPDENKAEDFLKQLHQADLNDIFIAGGVTVKQDVKTDSPSITEEYKGQDIELQLKPNMGILEHDGRRYKIIEETDLIESEHGYTFKPMTCNSKQFLIIRFSDKNKAYILEPCLVDLMNDTDLPLKDYSYKVPSPLIATIDQYNYSLGLEESSLENIHTKQQWPITWITGCRIKYNENGEKEIWANEPVSDELEDHEALVLRDLKCGYGWLFTVKTQTKFSVIRDL